MLERENAPADAGAIDDARPVDGAAQPGPASSPGTPEPAAPPAGLTQDDIDAAELAAAEAEAAAEATSGGGTPAPAADPPAATPPAQGAPPQPGQQPPQQIMVPKARLDELARRARAAEERALMLEGAVRVLTPQPGQQGTPQPQGNGGAAAPPAAPSAPPQQQQIDALRAEVAAAAEKFDAGEMTLRDFKAIEDRAQEQIFALREEALLARVPQPVQQTGIADEVIRQNFFATLYQQHPYAYGLNEAQAQHLAEMAKLELAAEGKPIGQGAAETMRLQTRVAELSNTWGPRWGVQPTQQTQAPSQPQQPANGRGGLSPDAQARMNKLNLAASLPPDTASLGAGAGSDNAITAARIETMSDEEIMALPASVRSRFLPE